MTDTASFAVLVGAALRQAGIEVPPTATVAFAEALSVLGMERPGAVFAAAEACLCTRREQRRTVAEVLAEVMRGFGDIGAWRQYGDHVLVGSGGLSIVPEAGESAAVEEIGGDEGGELQLIAGEEAAEAAQDESPGPEPDDDEATAYGTVVASAIEVLQEKDFGECSPEELEELARLMPRVAHLVPTRRARRMVPAPRTSRGVPDLRRTVRRSLPLIGEPVRLARRRRGQRARRLVLLVDVSGSMAPYARTLLRFCHAAVVSERRVEAFLLATRCTRVTRQLGWRDPSVALVAAERAAPDMSGGTRLGDGLRTFNDEYGTGGMARGAIVVVCSDGWDRGDPSVLAEQMGRLARVAYRVVWVNPLKATEGYAPLARGMAAALPYVDHFVSGHSLAALGDLARVIAA